MVSLARWPLVNVPITQCGRKIVGSSHAEVLSMLRSLFLLFSLSLEIVLYMIYP